MSSAIERMIAFHLARLKDKNPDVRIKSIEELSLLGAVQVMDELETVFRTDLDENVRAAAKKAGRELFIKSRSNDNNKPG